METNKPWLSKNEIILKYWYSKQLEQKMDIILVKHGVNRSTNILDDCRAATFLELARMDADKLEALYNHKEGHKLEGYIIRMFKMVSIYTSNGNHKSSVVTNIKHGSSLDSNGFIDPTERAISDNGDSEDYNFIIEDKELDYISQNENFNYILSKLTDEEKDTLNLILDKKGSKGRYKKEVAAKVARLKEEIKQYVLENDDSFNYDNNNKQEFIIDEDVSLNDENIYMSVFTDRELLKLFKEVDLNELVRPNAVIIKSTKIKLKMIMQELAIRLKFKFNNKSFNSEELIIEAINTILIPFTLSEDYKKLSK